MDIIALTALLSPCLPFLLKAAESASADIGQDTWATTKKIWEKLRPKLEAKESARIAAEQVAANPTSEGRQQFLREELAALLQNDPELAAAIAQILQENPVPSGTVQVNQTVTGNQGQVIGQMTGGKAIGRIDGNVQGGINF